MNYQGDSVCVFPSSTVSNTGVTAGIFGLKESMSGKFQLWYMLHNTTCTLILESPKVWNKHSVEMLIWTLSHPLNLKDDLHFFLSFLRTYHYTFFTDTLLHSGKWKIYKVSGTLRTWKQNKTTTNPGVKRSRVLLPPNLTSLSLDLRNLQQHHPKWGLHLAQPGIFLLSLLTAYCPSSRLLLVSESPPPRRTEQPGSPPWPCTAPPYCWSWVELGGGLLKRFTCTYYSSITVKTYNTGLKK